jgi:hypothetical protein
MSINRINLNYYYFINNIFNFALIIRALFIKINNNNFLYLLYILYKKIYIKYLYCTPI